MTESPAAALVTIARDKARDGLGWDALTAQLAADSYVLSDVMAANPKVLLDVGPAWNLRLDSGSLREALTAYRASLLASAEVWDMAVPLRRGWASLDPMQDTELEAAEAGAFAASLLAGHDTAWLIETRSRRAQRMSLLARRLWKEGNTGGALRSAAEAESALFTAHHARESLATADPSLAVVRLGLLLAEHALNSLEPCSGAAEAMALYRQALEWASVTEDAPDWGEPWFQD